MLLHGLQSGTAVNFRLSDAQCPEADELLENITGRLEVTGRVLYLSDSGTKKQHYAVLEVDGIMSPVIVPVDQIKRLITLTGEKGDRQVITRKAD